MAFDDTFDEELEDGQLAIVMTANESTYKRLNASLAMLATARSRVRDILFGAVAVPPAMAALPFSPLNLGLNEAQQRAVGFCLAKNDVAVIHGPPGTGKTTTVVEVIAQMVQRGEKVGYLADG